jgi:hypothetical protein
MALRSIDLVCFTLVIGCSRWPIMLLPPLFNKRVALFEAAARASGSLQF